MKTIEHNASAEITEKKSKFISDLFYVETIEEAENKIQEIRKKYHDAKHHCFAYRILENNNIIERFSDDGEPSGTAGGPMLQILSKEEFVNVLVVVTRYFGGVLLGTGGLVRAYSQATSESILKAKLVDLEEGQVLKIPVSYQNLDYLQYYCRKNSIKIIQTNFDQEPYSIIEVSIVEKERLLSELEKKQFDIKRIQIVEEKYIRKNMQEKH